LNALGLNIHARHLRASGRETLRQSLAKATAGTGDENALGWFHGQLLRV
jgi:hypothetical protein